MAYAYDNGSTLNVSYLCKDGKNIDNDTVILTLEFKATAEGQSNLQYTAYDCVNSSAESVEISQCSSGKVSVTKQGSEKSMIMKNRIQRNINPKAMKVQEIQKKAVLTNSVH